MTDFGKASKRYGIYITRDFVSNLSDLDTFAATCNVKPINNLDGEWPIVFESDTGKLYDAAELGQTVLDQGHGTPIKIT